MPRAANSKPLCRAMSWFPEAMGNERDIERNFSEHVGASRQILWTRCSICKERQMLQMQSKNSSNIPNGERSSLRMTIERYLNISNLRLLDTRMDACHASTVSLGLSQISASPDSVQNHRNACTRRYC